MVILRCLAARTIAIIAMMDDRIHDEDYIIETYEYPILAKIPDLVNTDGKKYSYYYESKSHHGHSNSSSNASNSSDATDVSNK